MSESNTKKGDSFIHYGQNSNSNSGSIMLQQSDVPGIKEAPTNDGSVPQVPMQEKSTLPIKNVTNIMRKGLPPKSKISNGAKEMAEQSASKFINLVTKKAAERCQTESRIIMGADDLLWAMKILGFNDYVEGLTLYSQRYRCSNGLGPMQPVVENSKPTLPSLPPSPGDVGPNSSMSPNTTIEMYDAMDLDEFWAGLDDLGIGPSDNASTSFDTSVEFNFDGIFGEENDEMEH